MNFETSSLSTKLSTRLGAELFQHLANLFQVTLLVITNEVNSRSAVNPAEKGMIKNQSSKTFRAVQIAKVLQRLSRAIVICQHQLFLRHFDRVNRLRRLKLSNAQRDDRRRQESFEKTYASRFSGDPARQIFNDAFLDQIKMLQYLSDAPFPIGRPLHEQLFIKRLNRVQQVLVNHVQPLQRSIHVFGIPMVRSCR